MTTATITCIDKVTGSTITINGEVAPDFVLFPRTPRFLKGQRVRINGEYVIDGYWLREGDTALVVEDSSTVTHETRVAFDGHQNMVGAYADLVPTSWLEVAA